MVYFVGSPPSPVAPEGRIRPPSKAARTQDLRVVIGGMVALQKVQLIAQSLMVDVQDIEKKVLALSLRPTERFLELGHALRALKDSSREEYRRVVKKAGLGTRKAYYLINLAEQLQVSSGFRTRLHQIGWTKSKLIGKHRAGINFVKLIEYAESHTTKQLEAYVAREKSADTRCVLLYFTPGEYRRYEEAVLKFGARKRGRGLIDKEKATIKMAKKILAD